MFKLNDAKKPVRKGLDTRRHMQVSMVTYSQYSEDGIIKSDWRSPGGTAGCYWLELWACEQKVAGSNPRDDKVKICPSASEQGK